MDNLLLLILCLSHTLTVNPCREDVDLFKCHSTVAAPASAFFFFLFLLLLFLAGVLSACPAAGACLSSVSEASDSSSEGAGLFSQTGEVFTVTSGSLKHTVKINRLKPNSCSSVIQNVKLYKRYGDGTQVRCVLFIASACSSVKVDQNGCIFFSIIYALQKI